MASAPALYMFIDEGGNLDFSPRGTKYFTITSVTVSRPFPLDSALTDLRFNLIEFGLDLQEFHASTNKQPVRDRVFALLQSELSSFRVDCVLVEKRKTGPSLRADEEFYPKMLGYLLQYVINGTDLSKWSEVIVITDQLPIKRKRRAIEKAVKTTLVAMLPTGVSFRLLHHDSKSCSGLQIADYFNWAIYRARENNDYRSVKLVQPAIQSCFDIFQRGNTLWY